MTKYYKAQILDLCFYRTSTSDYQYAVIYRNLQTQCCGASFHKNYENAVKRYQLVEKRNFLEGVDIRKVQEISKDEYQKKVTA